MGKIRNYINYLNWKVKEINNQLRKKLLFTIQNKLISSENITIISEDCIGGAIYQFIGKQYQSPTVGLWISCPDYIKFIKELDNLSNFSFEFENNNNFNYPVGLINGIRIGFQHYNSHKEVIEKWEKRFNRINFNKIFYKIDFRYPWYTQKDIDNWNSMKLSRSIALVNDETIKKFGIIHNCFIINSSQEFNNTKKELFSKFVYWKWFNNNIIELPDFFTRILLKTINLLYK